MAYDYSDILEKAQELCGDFSPQSICDEGEVLPAEYLFLEDQLIDFIKYILGCK